MAQEIVHLYSEGAISFKSLRTSPTTHTPNTPTLPKTPPTPISLDFHQSLLGKLK